MKYKNDYCSYCKETTKHEIEEDNKLICVKCGSSRMNKIQGFNASLM